MTNQIINQTQFASQEPVLENPVVVETEQKSASQAKKKPKKVLLIGLIAFTAFIFLLLIIVIAIKGNSGDNGQKEEEVKEVVEEKIENDPKQLRLKQLKADLQNADPVKKELIFPPVNLNLELDKLQQ